MFHCILYCLTPEKAFNYITYINLTELFFVLFLKKTIKRRLRISSRGISTAFKDILTVTML